jgi:ligand-binding SRPBCC domain-containing protein
VQTIHLETRIAAPAHRCFLLALSIDLHMDSTAGTRERAVAGVTTGLIGEGDSVTWRGRHFGLMLQHTSRITQYKPPTFFQDVMTAGLFKSFEHDHRFQEQDGETVMRDELRFAPPLGVLGLVVGRLVLHDYLARFLLERNKFIKQIAESEMWREYLSKTESFQKDDSADTFQRRIDKR